MTDLTKLSAAKLTALRDKRSAATSKIGKKLIEAGFGNEFHRDTRKRAAETGDPLANAYVEAFDAEHAVYDEERSRLAYSGTLKPIRRK